MAFTKSFPKTADKYTTWEEISLSPAEEREQEAVARRENMEKMRESIADAREIMKSEDLKDFQSNMVDIALYLFEKRASHEVYYKENRAREKFEKSSR